ncbi:TadE family type IV pilus minor pilin [Streptomyces axinellae]|uniref:TadE family type IV pilus minor pilin n=1 Tax=Streptomyces axinellae TaxID=552788 RepID=UPI0031D29E82
MAGRRGRWAADLSAGYVTAEAAVVIPALVLLMAGLLWGLMAAVVRIQCVDAARAGARAAARGEPVSTVQNAVRSAASGARTQVAREGELVRVVVRVRTAGPGPLTVQLKSEAVALNERSAGDGTGAGAGEKAEAGDESAVVARGGP